MLKLSILLLFYGTALPSLAKVTQVNPCSTLLDCLNEKIIHLESNGPGWIPNLFDDLKGFDHCDNEYLTTIANTWRDRHHKGIDRFRKTKSCIEGKNQEATGLGFSGCPITMDGASKVVRECYNAPDVFNKVLKELYPSNDRLHKKSANLLGCTYKPCDCPEAEICNQCYETSELHDDINEIALKLLTIPQNCGTFPKKPENLEG